MCPASLVTWYNYSYKNNRSSINKKNIQYLRGPQESRKSRAMPHTTAARETHTFNTYRHTGEQNTPHTDFNALLQKHIITLQLCFFTERWHVVIQASWVSVKPLALSTLPDARRLQQRRGATLSAEGRDPAEVSGGIFGTMTSSLFSIWISFHTCIIFHYCSEWFLSCMLMCCY